MDIDAYNAQIQKIANALWDVEAYMGTGLRMSALHNALNGGLLMLRADVPGIVTPAGGSNKPPSPAAPEKSGG